MILSEAVRSIIEAPADNSRILVKGPTGSGKSTILAERYRYLTGKRCVPGEKILVLLLNRERFAEWDSKASSQEADYMWRTTYASFIRDEVNLFYPLILKNCSEIGAKNIRPFFLNFDFSRALLAKVIEARRNNDGMFAAVTSYSENIASDLLSNLSTASVSGIPYREIGKRLFHALEIKDEIKMKLYEEADKILEAYRSKCLELGILDFSMLVELYRDCLLVDAKYREHLAGRVHHLIVDNIEECTPAETDLIQFLMKHARTCLLGYNNEGGCGLHPGSDQAYMERQLLTGCDVFELKKSYTCSEFMVEFSDMLFEDIANSAGAGRRNNVLIVREPPLELRSEMLEKIGDKICKLIREEGYKPSDIVVLSTYADPVTEYVIGSIVEGHGYRMKNISRKDRMGDIEPIRVLTAFAKLCHPEYRLHIFKNDTAALLRAVFRIDPVRCSLLAGHICGQTPYPGFPDMDAAVLSELAGEGNVDKYNYVKDWIRDYRSGENRTSPDEFFRKAFTEVIAGEDVSKRDMENVNMLADIAAGFVNVVSHFGVNAGKEFLKVLEQNLTAPQSISENSTENEEKVLLATPADYLAGPFKSKVTLLAGISSENWSPRCMKELTNPHVLKKSWNEKHIYSEELEVANQRHYLAVVMRAVLKRCSDKLVVFESMLSANGYENSGLLADYFDA